MKLPESVYHEEYGHTFKLGFLVNTELDDGALTVKGFVSFHASNGSMHFYNFEALQKIKYNGKFGYSNSGWVLVFIDGTWSFKNLSGVTLDMEVSKSIEEFLEFVELYRERMEFYHIGIRQEGEPK